MAIQFVSSIREAGDAISGYLITHGAGLPAWAREKVVEAISHPNPARRIVGVAEALYASHAALDAPSRELCAVLIQFATMQSWHGLQNDGRGGRIMQAMQRENGEAAPINMTWPDASSDPAPLKAYVQPVPPAQEEEDASDA